MESSIPDTNFPAVNFLACDEWNDVNWSGTTFRWHPTGEAPPIMGLVFENASAGRAIFREWTDLAGNQDSFEELRVTIVEGEFPETKPGYIVHFCPDPQNTLAHATADGVVFDIEQFSFLCRANKMDFLQDSPPMLQSFKQEFAKHGEYLLAPVTKGHDGQSYVDVELGIIKNKIEFMTVDEITAEMKAQGFDIEQLQQMLLDVENGDVPELD